MSIREQIIRTMLDLMPGTEIEDSAVHVATDQPIQTEEYVHDPRN